MTDLPADIRPLLDRFHFDEARFDLLRRRVARTAELDSLHLIEEPLTVPAEDVTVSLPAEGTPERTRLHAAGAAAIDRGDVAAVVLAGGMATRFGGTVKALAPVMQDSKLTFLDLKLGGLRGVDTALMTSFASDELLAATGAKTAPQQLALRLQGSGQLFLDGSGRPSPYATGHGDLPDALRFAGLLERYRKNGVRTVLAVNVDNIGATLDPALYALHRELGGSITAELVRKVDGDVGGIPVRRGDGSLVLAETFRLPSSVPHDRFPLFNTNTLWIDLDVLEAQGPWTWCVARKQVDGREAIQLERLLGELTWWHPSRYVAVPREGVATRFLPVKTPHDLVAARDRIAAICTERLSLKL